MASPLVQKGSLSIPNGRGAAHAGLRRAEPPVSAKKGTSRRVGRRRGLPRATGRHAPSVEAYGAAPWSCSEASMRCCTSRLAVAQKRCRVRCAFDVHGCRDTLVDRSLKESRAGYRRGRNLVLAAGQMNECLHQRLGLQITLKVRMLDDRLRNRDPATFDAGFVRLRLGVRRVRHQNFMNSHAPRG